MKLSIQLNVVGPYWFGGYRFDVNAENQNWIEFPTRIQGKSIFRDFLKRFKSRITGVKIEGTAEDINVFSKIVKETLPEVELITKEVAPEPPEQPEEEEVKVGDPAKTEEPKDESKVEDPEPDQELVDEVKTLMDELFEVFSESEAAEFIKGQHDLGLNKVDALTALRDKLIEKKKELEAQAQAAEETKEPEIPESPEGPQDESKVEDPGNPEEPAADPDPESEQPKEEAKVEDPASDPEPQDPDPESEQPKDEE